MCLEITYSTIAKYPEISFDVLKLAKMKNPVFFKKLASQKSCDNSKDFENLLVLQVCCLVFTKSFEWLASGTVFRQNSLNSSRVKYAENHKIQRVNYISCGGYLNTLSMG